MRIAVLTVSSLVLASSCGVLGLSDHMVCEFADSDGEYSTCGDWKNVPFQYQSTIQALCRGTGAKYSTGSCPTEKRIAGCNAMEEGADATTWYYQSKKFPTVSSTLTDCDANKTWVDPSGTAADRGNGECTYTAGMSGGILVWTYLSRVSEEFSIFLRDDTCTEVFKQVVEPMGGKGQPTKAGEVLVIRAGNNNPFGKILNEQKITASGATTIQ